MLIHSVPRRSYGHVKFSNSVTASDGQQRRKRFFAKAGVEVESLLVVQILSGVQYAHYAAHS
jgi:hypothetical protein